MIIPSKGFMGEEAKEPWRQALPHHNSDKILYIKEVIMYNFYCYLYKFFIYYQYDEFIGDFSYAPLLEAVLQKMREKGDKEIKEIPDFQRREKLYKNLETVVKEIRQFYNPKKIILFGS